MNLLSEILANLSFFKDAPLKIIFYFINILGFNRKKKDKFVFYKEINKNKNKYEKEKR